MNMFIESYNAIAAVFGKKFTSHKCKKNTKIDWPNGFGVYVVWKISSSNNELIYVGMTGKIKKDIGGGYAINEGNFSKRKDRYTPYFFQEIQNDTFSFRFGPKHSKGSIQSKIRLEIDAYSETIPYENLRVDFFTFSSNVEENYGYTPSLLEAELLSKYLIENKSLPPANFEI